MDMNFPTDLDSMKYAETPQEWLIAAFDEWGDGLQNADDIHHRHLFDIINDHGPDYPNENQEEDPDCSPSRNKPLSDATSDCRYWSGAATWPHTDSYLRVRLEPTVTDSQEYHDLCEADVRLDMAARAH